MKHGEVLKLPGTNLWGVVGRDETERRVRDLPADADFDPSTDRIVVVDRDVVLMQVMYAGIYSPAEAEQLKAILGKYVDFSKFG